MKLMVERRGKLTAKVVGHFPDRTLQLYGHATYVVLNLKQQTVSKTT